MAYKESLELAVIGPQPATLTDAQLLSSPFDFIYVSVDGAPRVSLMKATSNGSLVTWSSFDQAGLVFHDTRLIRTMGFTNDLLNVISPSFHSAEPVSLHVDKNLKSELVVIHDDPRSSSMHLTSEIVDISDSFFVYDNYKIRAYKITEKLSSISLDTGFESFQYYWFDYDTGDLLSTVQQPSPSSPIFQIVEISKITRLVSDSKHN